MIGAISSKYDEDFIFGFDNLSDREQIEKKFCLMKGSIPMHSSSLLALGGLNKCGIIIGV